MECPRGCCSRNVCGGYTQIAAQRRIVLIKPMKDSHGRTISFGVRAICVVRSIPKFFALVGL